MGLALMTGGFTAKDYEAKYKNGLTGSPIADIASTWKDSIFNTSNPAIQDVSLKNARGWLIGAKVKPGALYGAYYASWDEVINPATNKPSTINTIIHLAFNITV